MRPEGGSRLTLITFTAGRAPSGFHLLLLLESHGVVGRVPVFMGRTRSPTRRHQADRWYHHCSQSAAAGRRGVRQTKIAAQGVGTFLP